ncbi:MAG: hypothetical protein HKN23_11325 [Verrucomicrobiales bacterium]|nr:hypothetical protein [Verrucomicrobiales bacterium]
MKHRLWMAVLAAFLIGLTLPVEVSAQKKTAGKSTTSKAMKPKLTAEEKKELAEAEKILKKLDTYKKGKFTRLLNSGNKAHILSLPGIGEKTAERIIEARPLESSAHVVLVQGVGLKTFEELVKSRL